MIMPNNRFSNQEEPSPREQAYQYCISEIFDYVHNLSSRLGISMEESLGLLDIVKGSIKLNISINKREQQEEQESEESDYDDY